MPRRRLIALIVIGLILFFAISAVLARVFSATNAEQAAVTDLVTAEARGDAAAVVADLDGCDRSQACQAGVAADVAALKHPGTVQIAQYSPSTSFSLSTTVGVARVAWAAGDSKPYVQCVRVRRAGNALSGQTIELLVLSARIRSGADCPKHF
jgi:hypothetical protein